MNLIPLDSWHRAQERPGIGFRINCVAVVECCSCGPVVWILTQSVVKKRICRVASSFTISASNHQGLESVMAITRFQTGVSWHFRSFKEYSSSENRTRSASVTLPRGL